MQQIKDVLRQKKLNASLLVIDSSTITITQKYVLSDVEFEGGIFQFSNNKLYDMSFMFKEKDYHKIKNKLTDKYGFKYTTDSITGTYVMYTWTFDEDKTVILSMDYENKNGILQYNNPNIAENNF
jgi:hypothetical protein